MRSPIVLFLFTLLFCSQDALEAQVAVVNGASFRSDQPVTAGSWAAAFGTFANVPDTVASALPLPKTLGRVTLTIDGVEAPLLFVSSRQINFLIPYQTTPGLKPIELRTAAGTLSGSVRVITAAPGLFVKDTTQQQPPKGAVLNQDASENTSSNPVRRGQVVSIFGTGPGALSRAVGDGAAAPRDPLAATRSTPQVYIGGLEAQVQFSGLAPDFAGLWQINAFVPDRAFLSGRVPIQVFIDGVDSNEVTIYVAP